MTGSSVLFLLLPARLALLPIGQSVPLCRGAAAALARRFDHGGIVAVEEVGAARERGEVLGLDPVDEDQHRRAVRVLNPLAEPDRLVRGVAVAPRAMRQKARVVIGPQQGAQMLDALGRGGPDNDAVALCPGSLQEARQGAFERRRQQMIEADLGHGGLPMGASGGSALLVMIGDKA